MGSFSDSTWQMDKNIHFEFSGPEDTLAKSDHFTFIAQDKTLYNDQIQEVALACENNYQRMCAFLEKEPDNFKLHYRIHSTMETKGLQFNNTDLMHFDGQKKVVHVIWNDYMKGMLQQGENLALVQELLGHAKYKAFEEGLALQFADTWHHRGIHYWAGLLASTGNMPNVNELFDNALFNKESPLVMQPAATILVEYLINKHGKNWLIEHYTKWKPNKEELMVMQIEWESYLNKRFEGWYPAEKKDKDRFFLKGFNFAHEGYRIYNGYGSNLAKKSLKKLENIGANAVAIVPYSYMRNPNRPSYLNLEHSPGSENDESVIFANAQAQKLGMYSLMKPQIWMGRSWPGDVLMESEEDWDRFFDYYYRWIRHYALLAEMYGFDGLSLGVEFAKATVAQEGRWRNLIKKIRPLFSGDLTYCANWGTEFEKMAFWDEFDYIGLNCYYPLSKEEKVDKASLKAKFKEISKKIEKVTSTFNKPLVFTEIGFRSVTAPWKNPHAEANGRAFSDEDQALCYEVIFEGINEMPWCKGILWWKWPSYLDYQGRQNTSFTPNNKSAEKVVRQWFSKTGRK